MSTQDEQNPENQSAPSEEPVSSNAQQIPNYPSVNYTHSIFSPLDDKAKSIRSEPLIYTPRSLSRVNLDDEDWSYSRKDSNFGEKDEYVGRVVYGLNNQQTIGFRTDGPFYQRPLRDETANWENALEYNGESIGLRMNRPMNTAGLGLQGTAALDAVSFAMGDGTSILFPLYHTGLHVKMITRTAAEYLAFQYKQTIAASTAGNDTYGIIHQNSHIGTIERVWEYIRDSITSVNLKDYQNFDLGDILPVTELPTLYWGQSCTMYPNGYPIDLACSSGVNKCTHVESMKLNLRLVHWTNKNALVKTQMSMLSTPKKLFTVDEVKAYKESGNSPITRKVVLNDNFTIYLGVPTINEYIQVGREWIEACVETANEIFKNEKEVTPEQVKAYVQNEMTLNAVREYAHWITKITVNDVGDIDKRADINKALERFSNDQTLSERIFEEIQTFIEDATVSIVATPNFACPKCQKDYGDVNNSKHPELVPLDMLKLFFQLMDRHLYRHSQNPMN